MCTIMSLFTINTIFSTTKYYLFVKMLVSFMKTEMISRWLWRLIIKVSSTKFHEMTLYWNEMYWESQFYQIRSLKNNLKWLNIWTVVGHELQFCMIVSISFKQTCQIFPALSPFEKNCEIKDLKDDCVIWYTSLTSLYFWTYCE